MLALNCAESRASRSLDLTLSTPSGQSMTAMTILDEQTVPMCHGADCWSAGRPPAAIDANNGDMPSDSSRHEISSRETGCSVKPAKGDNGSDGPEGIVRRTLVAGQGYHGKLGDGPERWIGHGLRRNSGGPIIVI